MGSLEEEAARTLLLTVGRILGPELAKGKILSLDSNFFSIGGNSLNSVSTVTSLKDLGYIIGEWLGWVVVTVWEECIVRRHGEEKRYQMEG